VRTSASRSGCGRLRIDSGQHCLPLDSLWHCARTGVDRPTPAGSAVPRASFR
jgi:hypothetical protein